MTMALRAPNISCDPEQQRRDNTWDQGKYERTYIVGKKPVDH